uniref:Uncharacterized protein n=1 Tax=Solanum lycopersicum TaxID=4081 RepID=A0A3Q7G0N2_SOLLC
FVDDILIHPLARASLDEASWLAKKIAADIGNQFQVTKCCALVLMRGSTEDEKMASGLYGFPIKQEKALEDQIL